MFHQETPQKPFQFLGHRHPRDKKCCPNRKDGQIESAVVVTHLSDPNRGHAYAGLLTSPGFLNLAFEGKPQPTRTPKAQVALLKQEPRQGNEHHRYPKQDQQMF
jgi:hypothetical protein